MHTHTAGKVFNEHRNSFVINVQPKLRKGGPKLPYRTHESVATSSNKSAYTSERTEMATTSLESGSNGLLRTWPFVNQETLLIPQSSVVLLLLGIVCNASVETLNEQ